MNRNLSIRFTTISTLFCVFLIAANLLEVKVVSLGGLTITAGMVIFPFSYVLGDCLVEIWGYKLFSKIIWLGFAMNFMVMAFGALAVLLPSPGYWNGAEHFNYMFSFAPRIVVASLAAFLAGSHLNAYIMEFMKNRSGERGFSFRAVLSTLAGEGLDSMVFFPIAFAGVLPMKELCLMTAVQTVIKTAVEVLVLPFTNLLVSHLRRVEKQLPE